MVELGELEKRHADFDKRNVRIYAISNDDVIVQEDTGEVSAPEDRLMPT